MRGHGAGRDALPLERFFARVAEELADPLGLPPDEVYRLLWEREQVGSTVLSPGLAVPHVLLEGTDCFVMLVARCRGGVRFPGQDEPVQAVFVLAGTPDQRTLHLRALSAISQIVHHPGFAVRWARAEGREALRAILRSAERRRF